MIMVNGLTRFAWLPAAGIAVLALVYVLRPAPLQVDVATIEHGDLQITVDEEGRTRVRDRFVVSAPVSGVLERVRVRVGDRVATHDIIAVLRPAPATPLDSRTEAQLRARLAASEQDVVRLRATLDAARAELAQAVVDAKRADTLLAAGAVSAEQAEVVFTRRRMREQAEHAAVAALRVAEHARDEARAALLAPSTASAAAPVHLRAPADGAVLRIAEEHERVVIAGTPLIEIGDPRSIEVVVDLLSTDAVRVKAGARVLLQDWGGEQTLHGIVRRIEPSTFTKISALGVEEQRANVIIDFDCPHEDFNGDGYTVDARIVLDTRRNVLIMPLGALVRERADWFVYVIDRDGRARARTVVPGARAAFDVEVVDGLAAGEQVILYPSDRVSEGIRVVAGHGDVGEGRE
jgi:HlyD family secretion protein